MPIPALIALSTTTIDGEAVQTVNARDLHVSLEVGADFSTWIKHRIDAYGFAQGTDFVCSTVLGSKGRGGHNAINYHLTLAMAKELAMVERNDAGRRVRGAFVCGYHTLPCDMCAQ